MLFSRFQDDFSHIDRQAALNIQLAHTLYAKRINRSVLLVAVDFVAVAVCFCFS